MNLGWKDQNKTTFILEMDEGRTSTNQQEDKKANPETKKSYIQEMT